MMLLPVRSLIYFLTLTGRIRMEISRATFLHSEYLLYSEASHPLAPHAVIDTGLSQSLSGPLPSTLPPAPLLGTPAALGTQRGPVVPRPSQCPGGLSALQLTVSDHKTRSSLGL